MGLYKVGINNVYQNNLVSIGREANGKQWAQNTWTLTQAQIEDKELFSTNPQISDFRKTIINSDEAKLILENQRSSVLSIAPSYVNKNISSES